MLKLRSGSVRNDALLLFFATFVLLLGGCDYVPPPRWVLWEYVGASSTWIPMTEYRTLKECNDAMGSSSASPTPKCLPYGQVVR